MLQVGVRNEDGAILQEKVNDLTKENEQLRHALTALSC